MSSNRKDDHVQLAEELTTEKGSAGTQAGGFNDLRFMHHSFNGLARDAVDISTTVTGTRWEVPFYINAMTGGSEKTGQINADLARAAAATGVAMASGSVSAALRDPSLEPTFRIVRDSAPEAFLFANVSPEASVDQARRAVDLLDADALQIHVNPAQELVMPEGDRDFRPWLDRIGEIVAGVDVPVVVKEVGFGLSRESIAELTERGVTTVDVSGRGGTNFIDIENHRRSRQEYSYLSGWGQSTPECLLDTLHGAAGAPEVDVLASGGVRTPLDVVRALALGARAVGVSGHFLHVLVTDGPEALVDELTAWTDQVRTLMTLLGAADVASLSATDVLVTGQTAEFARLLGVDLQKLAHRRK
ncbi:type 2 isopentenyl-diphosphate Delta-isomerase [Corynebacterium sp. USCH3]|uniref:type 2 isopentenyl-diphosphate Delta-isomerase n=1 Tax=Corynebacterium sp. USCH3 TaxID=3024840 RepID=UPI0030B0E081